MPVHRIKLGTYNVNNFFDRFDDPYNYADDRWGPRTTKSKDLDQIYNLGERLRQDKPDILALQEVENKGTMYEFNKSHLGGHFDELVLVEGNDPRGIQIAMMSKLPLGHIISYQFLRDLEDRIKIKLFSRDFMEVEVLDPETYQPIFTIFNSHLKSRFVDPTLKGSRREAAIQRGDYRRFRQAEAIAQIVKRRFPNPHQGLYVLAGDFNDVPTSDALAPLLQDPTLALYDVLSELPENKRWTHYWSEEKQRSQIDYILLSPAMRQRMIPNTAHVVQRGNSGGSDHRPVYVDLWVGFN